MTKSLAGLAAKRRPVNNFINGAIGAWTAGNSIVFRTHDLAYEIGTDGQNRGFYDRHTSANHLYATAPGSFMSVTKGGLTIGSTAVTLQGSILSVEFGDPGVSATVLVQVRPAYLTLELLSVSDPTITGVTLAYLPLVLTKRVGLTLAYCGGRHYAAAVVSLNVVTRSIPSSGASWSLLSAEADARVQLTGAKIAILGCRPLQLLRRLSRIEKENCLPHPILDGVWARRSYEVRTSYLFVDLTKLNADEIIGYAQRGGFRYIVVYHENWTSSYGTYPVNQFTFPNGNSDLQVVSAAVHAAGLKLGMHLLYMLIAKDSDLVTPVLHPGFFMVPGVTRKLAADIYPGQSEALIPTTTSPDGPDGFLAAGQKGPLTRHTELRGYSLRIDNEVIVYEDIQTTQPYGFTVKPANIKAPHSADALIENFAECLMDEKTTYYLPDLTGELWGQMTARVADIIQKFGFDFIYPDGFGEPLIPPLPVDLVPKWYLVNLLFSKLYGAIQSISRPVLFAHEPNIGRIPDLFTDYLWHVFSRGNTRDYLRPNGVDQVTSKRIIEYFASHSLPGSESEFIADRDLQPFEFGWFGYVLQYLNPKPNLPGGDATRPREIEYAWSKALAYGGAMSLETSQTCLEGNGRTGEVLDLIKLWEDLRLTNYFPESIRDQIKDPLKEIPLKEFTLRQGPTGQWEVLPIWYEEHQVDPLVSGSDHWTFSNPYGAQNVRIVIEAGPLGVTNPGLRVNSLASVQFQTILNEAWYLEYADDSGLRVFDGNGWPRAGSVLSGGSMLVQAGDNDVIFVCDQGQTAKVTLATLGQPLQ